MKAKATIAYESHHHPTELHEGITGFVYSRQVGLHFAEILESFFYVGESVLFDYTAQTTDR